MSPSEQSKERARQAYARRQELKSAKTSPAPKSPTARADAGSARPVSQQGKIVRQTAPNRGIAASEQSRQRARQAGAQHDLKAVETLPAQGSTAALAKAGVAQPVSQQSAVKASDSRALPKSRPLPEPPPQSERASEVGKSKAPSTTLRSPAADCNGDSGRGAGMHARQSQPPAALQQDRSAPRAEFAASLDSAAGAAAAEEPSQVNGEAAPDRGIHSGMALPKAQQLSFDDFAAPAPVRTASPVSQEPQGASTAERSSSEGSEGDGASGSTAARGVSQQEVGGSVQVQPARELANDSSPQPQPARTNVSAQGLTDVQARAQEAGKAEMSAEQIVSQANKLCPGGHKLCEYTTPHGEHSCDVCELPVAGQELLQRCDECDYDVCCICAAPTKVPTGSPTELLTDTPTDLADRQADGERTGA